MVSSQPKKFRVLVVEDSTFMRRVLETIFNSDDQLQVVGHASDGREAIALWYGVENTRTSGLVEPKARLEIEATAVVPLG